METNTFIRAWSRCRGMEVRIIPLDVTDSYLDVKKMVTRLTWQHGEYGGEGVELEAVNDIAKVTHLYRHEDASGRKQEDIQALRNDTQPKHSCGKS